jgi:hypothetical protein
MVYDEKFKRCVINYKDSEHTFKNCMKRSALIQDVTSTGKNSLPKSGLSNASRQQNGMEK